MKLLMLALLVGCGDPVPVEVPPPISEIAVGDAVLTWGAGRISLVDDGVEILRDATAAVELDGQRVLLSEGSITVSVDDVTGPLGDGVRLTMTRSAEGDTPGLVWRVTGWAARGWTVQLDIAHDAARSRELISTHPLLVERGLGGAFLPGRDPSRLRILENGSWNVFDFVADLVPGDVEDLGWGALLPGGFRGHSVSNWNHAVADLDGGPAWVAGALTTDASSPVLELTGLSSLGGGDGFSWLAASSAYQPHPIPLNAGDRLSSEAFWFRSTDDPVATLEEYATAVHDHRGLELWTERGHRVPNGWNSWSGSSSTGGYGTDVNEDMLLANLDVMATQLRDWGMDWFQLDDGYEPTYGDWWWREDRFPHGPAWLSQQIRDRGLRPGLWIAPFTFESDSETLAEHPDWMAGRSQVGELFGTEYAILDLTNPEVLQWIEDTTRTVVDEWGFDWLKMDFAYIALLGDDFQRPELTREQAWRGALGRMREVMGSDRFFMTVGITGLNYGLVDSSRLTLDSMPVWDRQPTDDVDDPLGQQGLKPTVRAAGRRWYLQNRVWVNHPDLMFFRANPNDPDWPALTFEEARAFATFVGLSGGLVKLGDRLVDLEPDALNVVRSLLPVYPTAARPLDVFRREFPERWHLRVEQGLDGAPGPWDVLGLFHWGRNHDLTTSPYTLVPDDPAPRLFSVDPVAMGLSGTSWLAWEFWTASFLGEVSGTFDVEVPSHDARVVTLRPRAEHPVFLGWNRQLSGGGTVLESEEWADGVLTLRFEAAAGTASAPFVWQVAAWAPAGWTLDEAVPEGATLTGFEVIGEGPVTRLRFEVEQTGELALVLRYREG